MSDGEHLDRILENHEDERIWEIGHERTSDRRIELRIEEHRKSQRHPGRRPRQQTKLPEEPSGDLRIALFVPGSGLSKLGLRLGT
jgi:hypothetical protein